MVLEPTPGDVERAPQHEPQVFLGTVARDSNFFASYLEVDAQPEMIAALVMTMGNVGNHVAGDDPWAYRVQLVRPLADLSFNGRIGFHAWKSDGHRLPHTSHLRCLPLMADFRRDTRTFELLAINLPAGCRTSNATVRSPVFIFLQ